MVAIDLRKQLEGLKCGERDDFQTHFDKLLRTVTQAQLPRIPLVFRTHPHALFHLHSHPHLRKTALRVNSLSKALRHCGSYRRLTEDQIGRAHV